MPGQPWLKYQQQQPPQNDPYAIEAPDKQAMPQTGDQAALTRAETDRAANEARNAAASGPFAGAQAQADVEAKRAAAAASRANAQQSEIPIQQRVSTLDTLVEQINRVQDLYDQSLKGKGIGSVAEYLPLPRNKQFDAAAAGLAEQGLAAFRVPGVGSQSDNELRQFVQANKPSASDYDETIEEKLRQLRLRVENNRHVLGLPPPQWRGGVPGAASGAAPGATPGAPPAGGPGGGQPPPLDPAGTGYIGAQGAPDPYQNKIIAIDRAAHQAWTQSMLQIPKGTMSDQALAATMDAQWRKIAGRPLSNALDVAHHYNQTGQLSGSIEYRPSGDLKRQVDEDRRKQDLISRQDISSARGRGGAMETADALMRAAANGVTWGGADKLEALTGPKSYTENLARERAIGQYDSQNHLPAQLTGTSLGLIGNETGIAHGLSAAAKAAPRFGSALATIPNGARRMTSDAAYGGIYGAMNSDGSPGSRAISALENAGVSAAGGAGGRIVGRGLGRVATGARDEAVQALTERGIPLTVGQIAGRGGFAGKVVKNVEDALMSIPILGSAIKQRRMAGVEGFNRESFKQALEPIAQTTNGQIAEQGVQAARHAVGQGYDRALNGVTINFADRVFARDLSRAIGQGQRLHPEIAKDFEAMIRDELAPVIANGHMSGEEYQALQQAFTKERVAWKGQPRGAKYASALRHVQGVLESLVRRQAPGVVPKLESANLSNRLSKTVEDAVGRAANSDGVFTPAQLGMAARQSGRRFGNSAATPDRPFFDLQRAGQQVLPSQLPNSGTFDRAALGYLLPAALGGAGYEAGLDPKYFGTMAALGIPFTPAGQKVFQAMLVKRPDLVRNIGQQMLRPNVNGSLFGAPAAAGALLAGQ